MSGRARDHALRLKAQYSEEESDETYLGLTDIDFAQSADRRYGLSTPDQMANDHKGISVAWEVAACDRRGAHDDCVSK